MGVFNQCVIPCSSGHIVIIYYMYHSSSFSPLLIIIRSPLFSVISFSPLLSRMKYGYTSNTVYFLPLSLKTCPVFISNALLCRAVISSRYCPVIFDFKYIFPAPFKKSFLSPSSLRPADTYCSSPYILKG